MLTPTKKYSLTEYFDREILAETRNEYIDGEIIEMTGGTPTHNRVIGNFFVALHQAIQDKP